MNASNWIYGILSFTVTVVLGIVLSGVGFVAYIDLPSFIIVLGGAYLLSLMSHGPKGLGQAYRVAIKGGSKAELLAAVEVFKHLDSTFNLLGITATILGFIAMLSFYGFGADPAGTTDMYLRGSAVAVLTYLYALIARFMLAGPFRARAATQVALLD